MMILLLSFFTLLSIPSVPRGSITAANELPVILDIVFSAGCSPWIFKRWIMKVIITTFQSDYISNRISFQLNILPFNDNFMMHRNIVNEITNVTKQYQNPLEKPSVNVSHLRGSLVLIFMKRAYSELCIPIEKSISLARSKVILRSAIPMSKSLFISFFIKPVQDPSSCNAPYTSIFSNDNVKLHCLANATDKS